MSLEQQKKNEDIDSVFHVRDNQSEILINGERLPEFDVFGTALNEL